MAPNQRVALTIMGSLLLLGVGRLWVFTSLTSKPEEIKTNIQGELQDQIAEDLAEKVQIPSDKTVHIKPIDTTTSPTLPTSTTTFPLTILLPPRVQQDAITTLLARIDPENHFTPTLLQPETLNTYLRAIDSMTIGSRQADIILLPWQEISRIHAWSTQVDRSATSAPTGQFHPQIGKLLTVSKSLFVPHAIDPRVTLTEVPTRNLSLGTFLQTHPSPLTLAPEKITPDTLLYTLTSIWLEQLYSASNLSLVSKLFVATVNTSCTFSRNCIQEGVSALRLPLSELTSTDIDSLVVSRFPTLNDTVPTTVRGRVIRGNDASSSIQQRLFRIQKYLAVMSSDQLPYESPLLPAYFPRLQRVMLQDEWGRIQPSIYKLALLEHSSKQLTQRFNILPLKQLFDGSYRPELYLEKRQENSTSGKK